MDDTCECECCGVKVDGHTYDLLGHQICDLCTDAFWTFLDGLFSDPEVLAAIRHRHFVGATQEWLDAHPGETPLNAEEIVSMTENGADIEALPTSQPRGDA